MMGPRFLGPTVLAASVWSIAAATGAQPSGTPAAPAHAGTVIQPPDIDRKAVKPAPHNVDPEIAVPAGRDRRQPESTVKRQRSKEARCKGPAAPCRQSKPK